MKRFRFFTSANTEIEAEDEEEAWKKFFEEIEGQPQQTAINWIEEHTVLDEKFKEEEEIYIKVVYKNVNAIFDFALPVVIKHLKYYTDQNVHEATEILATISSCPSKTIKVESYYFGYIVLNLLKEGKGHVYCKACRKTYDSNQLSSRPLGLGRTPFEVKNKLKEKGGMIKRLFGKRQHISGRGGEAYDCPKGHELIAKITWIS